MNMPHLHLQSSPKRGLRVYRNTDTGMIEVWDGDPENPESDCYIQLHPLVFEEVLDTLLLCKREIRRRFRPS